MDKYREDRELFIKALEEAICNRFDKTIAESPMTDECSEQHKARMAAIIAEANAKTKRLRRAKLIAALIAAALLLTGCTLFALRNQIKGFIEYIYETHISVASEDEAENGKITEVYTLSYVPEGYELMYERISTAHVVHRWKNSVGKRLQFVQYPIGKFHMDVSDGNTEVIEYAGTKVYCNKSERTYNYIWCDKENCFNLISYAELEQGELIKILNGMVIRE